ncbi:hypothetical protein DJ010_14390 [Nocardioides silvaticus]|uniref:Big-1 domain-containing protein n=1 Tax=Nocardioides silvaticus TaxID=2201891 RepID=A0A316TER5_9ACTN|nr:hypothetical protein [Nocardioides silvaticus]PWN02298.1 hypothetical protein DJ010_14390 [Nocardioides silvaticus]
MNSSGIRRGLAVAAVSALVAVAAPLAANANEIMDQMDSAFPAGAKVTLYGPHPGADQITVKNDGYNTTVGLEAGGTSDIDTMRFQYSTDGGATWINIGGVITSPNADGTFAREWNPVADSGLSIPTAGLLVRANGHSTLDGNNHPGAGVPVTLTNTQDVMSIAPLTDVGVWKAAGGAHNIIVNGRASYNGNGTLGVGEPVTGTRINVANVPIAGGEWKTVYNIAPVMSSANFQYNAPDELVLSATTSNANPTAGDTEAITLYDQVLTKLTVTANPTNPADPNQNVPVTVTALDQFDKPIAGVRILDDELLAPGTFTNTGVTNANGQVTTNQSVNDGTVQYVANVAAGNQFAYDPGLNDLLTPLTLGAGFASDLTGSSNDGLAFDFDENDANDIKVQVKDQGGNNFDVQAVNQDLTYFWKRIPFDPSVEPEDGDSHVVANEANGLFDIPVLDPADFPDNQLPSGTYELWASLSDGGTGHPVAAKRVLTVKAGEAAVEYDVAKTVAEIGSTPTVNGNLVLEDGTGLVGRRIQLDVNAGTEYDEDGPTGAGDAVLVSNDQVTTGAGGSFSAQIEDLSTDLSESELGARLRATSLPAAGPSPDGDWNDGPFDHFLDFVTTQVPNGAVLDVEWDNTTGGPAGNLQNGDLHLEDAFGDDLAGVQVELTLDHGFFTDGYEGPAAGNYDPTPDSLGDSIIVSTDANGNADFQGSIGRDNGFDDDNHVIATVTGEADSATDSDSIDWNAANPLNVSEIEVTRTAGQLDPAPTNGGVLYDVYAWDQFGNPVRGVDVSIECTLELGDDDLCPTGAPIITESDLDNGGDALLVSNEPGTFEYLAEATSPNTQVYNNSLVLVNDNPTFTFQETWYEPKVNPAEGATYTIDPENPSTPVPVDEPITVTVEADDQEGNPLSGLFVQFVRTSDSDNDQTFVTDADGIAQYVFEGRDDQCGENDTVTAVVRESVNGPVVTTLVTKITFEKCEVDVSLEGSNSKNGKRDVLKVTATAEQKLTGVGVHLMARKGGKWVELTPQADRVLTAAGTATFSVKDTNGNKVTKYRAVVDEGSKTASAQSQVLRRR